jgi:hypothetical protein
MIYINEETAKLILAEEQIEIFDNANEYLLKTGAKLYPPNDRCKEWRISGYTSKDLIPYCTYLNF